MAQRVARRVIHNPGRLSDKQIKYFGTPAQKAALKRKRTRRRNAGGGLFRKIKKAVSRRIHTPRTRPRRAKQSSNPGEILSLVANPARKRRKRAMAKAHRRRKRAASNPARRTRRRKASTSRPRHRRRSRTNPSRIVYRTRRHRRAHRNPRGGDGGGIAGLFTNALWLIGGAVGTKVLTQAVLGASNAGIMGYIGNAVAAFGLSLLVGKLLKNPAAGRAVLSGGVVALVLRLLSDYTPLGQYTSAIGMGDYQVSHWVTPQRYVDALNSAEVEIPAGWAPTVIQSNAAPGAAKGMANYGGSGGGMYTSGGLYST